MVGECGPCWFLFHFILLLFLGEGGGGWGSPYIPFYIFTVTSRTVRWSVARNAVVFCVCLKSPIAWRLESKWARFFVLNSHSLCIFATAAVIIKVGCQILRNWVWYRQGKAKYIQGPLYRYSAAEVDFTIIWQISVHFQTIVFWASLPI